MRKGAASGSACTAMLSFKFTIRETPLTGLRRRPAEIQLRSFIPLRLQLFGKFPMPLEGITYGRTESRIELAENYERRTFRPSSCNASTGFSKPRRLRPSTFKTRWRVAHFFATRKSERVPLAYGAPDTVDVPCISASRSVAIWSVRTQSVGPASEPERNWGAAARSQLVPALAASTHRWGSAA